MLAVTVMVNLLVAHILDGFFEQDAVLRATKLPIYQLIATKLQVNSYQATSYELQDAVFEPEMGEAAAQHGRFRVTLGDLCTASCDL